MIPTEYVIILAVLGVILIVLGLIALKQSKRTKATPEPVNKWKPPEMKFKIHKEWK